MQFLVLFHPFRLPLFPVLYAAHIIVTPLYQSEIRKAPLHLIKEHLWPMNHHHCLSVREFGLKPVLPRLLTAKVLGIRLAHVILHAIPFPAYRFRLLAYAVETIARPLHDALRAQILRASFFITHQPWEPTPEEVPKLILIRVNALQQITLSHVPFFRFLYPFTRIAEVQDTVVEQHLCIPTLHAFAKKMYLVFRHVHTISSAP